MNNDIDFLKIDKKYRYAGKLGVIYSIEKTIFKLWSPLADKVEIKIYNEGNVSSILEILSMEKKDKGVWYLEKKGDCHGLYYIYLVYFSNKINEVIDPYCRAVGVNGKLAMVVDLERTNPKDWYKDKRPFIHNITDSIIYETHIRDITINKNSGVSELCKGKFKGIIEEDTCIPGTNIKTSLAHLKELGITHIHILPCFDFASIDEENLHKSKYNWGYDPENYNVPEGSYSSNPYYGEIRIREFKELVQSLHRNGIRIVMDVVYNHTFSGENSNLNLSMPGYFYRLDKYGRFSNGSGCGNELASEHFMVRKYIVESVIYWAKEYHIDGFRFDLMALHDLDTMKEVREELDKIDKSIIIYGEGWTGGVSKLSEEESCSKKNIRKFGSLQVAAFSDDIRDGVKGSVLNFKEGGFVSGVKGLEESIKFGVVASTYHNQIYYSMVNNSKYPWANEPYQTITYISCHDNHTLWDKLQLVNPNLSEDELIKENKLAAAILLTCQGISFIHGGEEFLRSKKNYHREFVENSYNSPDYVNSLDWNRKIKYSDVFQYYKGLITLRKYNKAFHLDSNKEIQQYIRFFEKDKDFYDNNVVAYNINGQGNFKGWNNVIVIFNVNNKNITVNLPEKHWYLVVNNEKAGLDILKEIKKDNIIVNRKSCFVLVKNLI